ncbi:hypothetical protein AVEN_208187-1 [Araneus ventricosus]|uniref:Uncharacterized protein n=1 Tax=Araneus ventricosus TaxID=182803 RepID=A0A4Y2IYA0_ARAVE|nr:hypothetical protein AVEN_208187-1 [Araneus ventricosus]
MLPVLHASGHLNYAKSTHVCLQNCLKLLTSLNAAEYDLFITCGYFTIRCNEKFWSGIWSDMMIKYVLMRSISRSGRLTKRRGITATTIATWINSISKCSRIVEVMEEFEGVYSVSSELHEDLREANQKRNSKDLRTFISWLEEHNHFSKPSELSSLSTGVVADGKKEKGSCEVSRHYHEISDNSQR